MGIIEEAMKVNDLINYAWNVTDYDVEKYDKVPATRIGDERRLKSHQLIAGKALKLLDRVLQNDGTADEVLRASKWLLVAMDAVKYHIDYVSARKKLGVKELEKKFPATRK